MDSANSFWTIFWGFFWVYVIIASLSVLFVIFADILRDHELKGWAKAIWVLFLVFVPFVTAIIYVIWRGQGTSRRDAESAQKVPAATEIHARSNVGLSRADEIGKATALYDNGSITDDEYAILKAKLFR